MKFDLSPENLEAERQRFADFVVLTATNSSDNDELLRRLKDNLPEGFMEPIGTGSTRRCYAARLGVTIKVQRESVFEDPLTDTQLEARGGKDYLLHLGWRRRMANFAEMYYAMKYPTIVPTVYGFLASFGIVQKHPSIIIAETVRTLDRFLEGVHHEFANQDIKMDHKGRLWIFDRRVTSQSKPENLIPCAAPDDFSSVRACNLGVTPDGRYVFVDRGDNTNTSKLINQLTLSPPRLGASPTPTQNLELSKKLLSIYREAVRKEGELYGE